MAMCKHTDGEILREVAAATRDLIKVDYSQWKIKFWNKDLLTGDKKNEIVDETENEELWINTENLSVDKEVERRLGYKYKFKEGSF